MPENSDAAMPRRVTGLERAVGAYLDHLQVERGLAPNSLAAYRRDLTRYVGFCGSQGITEPSEVTDTVLADFVVALRQGGEDHRPLAASSAGRAIVAVRGFHKFAAAEGLAASDPARQVRPPTLPSRLPKAISVQEVEAILEATGSDDLPPELRDRALVEVLYGTGARISEAVGLDIDDLDLENASILLRGKGSKQRIVPLGRMAVAALEAYLVRARPILAMSGRGGPAVFLNQRGGRLTRQGAWTVLAQAVERSGVTAAVSKFSYAAAKAGIASVRCTPLHIRVHASDLRLWPRLGVEVTDVISPFGRRALAQSHLRGLV